MHRLRPWLLAVLLLMGGCDKSDNNPMSGFPDGTAATDSNDADIDSDETQDDDTDAQSRRDTAPTEVDECADIPWDVSTEPFNLLILLDRSGSMSTTMDGGDQTYAEVVANAINTIVRTNTSSGLINFALNVFPSDTTCTAQQWNEWMTHCIDCQDVDITCDPASGYDGNDQSPGAPTVAFNLTSPDSIADEIESKLGTIGECGGTPICKTLEWARAWLNQQSDLTGTTFVLLATDGAPNCNPNLNHGNCVDADGKEQSNTPQECLDDVCAQNAAYRLIVDGYRTFVIGVGNDAAGYAADTLDAIAFFGGGNSAGEIPQTPAVTSAPGDSNWFFPATNANALTEAFESITNEAMSCDFQIDWSKIPDVQEGTGTPVQKRCDSVNVLGNLTAVDTSTTEQDTASVDTDSSTIDINDGKQLITYMPDCKTETDDTPGWNWGDPNIRGFSWEQIQDLEDDVSDCRTVHLCPKACEQIKYRSGNRTWSGVAARFGCMPIVIIE